MARLLSEPDTVVTSDDAAVVAGFSLAALPERSMPTPTRPIARCGSRSDPPDAERLAIS